MGQNEYIISSFVWGSRGPLEKNLLEPKETNYLCIF